MKTPTRQLMDEHAGIKEMLQVLEQICLRSRSAGRLACDQFDRILEFFTVFVDACHHAKEEELLFPALERAGVARDGGPIGELLEEHARGREHVKALRAYFTGAGGNGADSRGSLEALVHEAGTYISLLRTHIDKEDTVLYPMADRLLSPQQQEALTAGFAAIENTKIGQGRHEAFHRLLAELKKTYGTGHGQ